MKLAEIYRLAVKKGMGKDPRGASEIREEFKAAKKEYRLYLRMKILRNVNL